MIVKTFIGKDAKEIEERIFQIYGPQAIILTSVELAPEQVEVNFGVEEEEFIAYQNSIKSDDEDDLEGFWDEDTIPDVEYIATTTSNVLEAAVERKISSQNTDVEDEKLRSFLMARGLSPAICESVIHQSADNEQLLKALSSHIKCVHETSSFAEEKLLSLSSIEGVSIEASARKLIQYLQSEGKSVRAALVTEKRTTSQEYDIIHTWDELNDYISNYIHKCDHLLIITKDTKAFVEQWPAAHVLHFVNALWKPSDVSSYLQTYAFHKNRSLVVKGIEVSVSPGTIVDSEHPPIRFLDQADSYMKKAEPEEIAKVILAHAQDIHNS